MKRVVSDVSVAWFLTAIVTIPLLGCGYPEVSPKAYELSKALYSACNRKSEVHLEKVQDLSDRAHEAGEITDKESEWLTEIVDDARSGDWEAAADEARQIMEDQVRF